MGSGLSHVLNWILAFTLTLTLTRPQTVPGDTSPSLEEKPGGLQVETLNVSWFKPAVPPTHVTLADQFPTLDLSWQVSAGPVSCPDLRGLHGLALGLSLPPLHAHRLPGQGALPAACTPAHQRLITAARCSREHAARGLARNLPAFQHRQNGILLARPARALVPASWV